MYQCVCAVVVVVSGAKHIQNINISMVIKLHIETTSDKRCNGVVYNLGPDIYSSVSLETATYRSITGRALVI